MAFEYQYNTILFPDIRRVEAFQEGRVAFGHHLPDYNGCLGVESIEFCVNADSQEAYLAFAERSGLGLILG